MSKKTLILDSILIGRLVDIRRVIGIVEEAFREYGQGRAQMPAKIYLHLDKYKGDFRAMPAYIERIDACGIKWVNVHPGNKKRGLPTVMAVIILSDPRTGFPLAIMDGTAITNLRTGATGAVAAKYMANKDSCRISLVGCGNQAQTQLAALGEIFKIKSAQVYDHDPLKADNFIKRMGFLGIKMKRCENIRDCLRGQDIVVTTTPSRVPIVKREWIWPGTHINAIGADAKGKEELEPAILKNARVVVDDRMQALHSGEINVPVAKRIIKESDIYATLGEIVTGRKRGRSGRGEITVFDSTGLAICDVAVANYVYKEAAKKRLGKYIEILK